MGVNQKMTAALTDNAPYHNARTGGEELERVLQRSDWLIDLAGLLGLVVFGDSSEDGQRPARPNIALRSEQI
jgi:hypothetical protein